ncbi:phage integrase Arm DNA-binding domain-containing protein [Ralstonia wenshanensis]|uniref:phage integrase Arm DNA-binding domain-containing protein n=1 Tax=Ralstonia wenshanensis TaxID=2842456 RepID=UPI003D983305
MAARPRIRKRANWPANLYEPRQGYYTFRDPRDGKVHVLGRIPLAQAIFEVQEANASIEGGNRRSLVERIGSGSETIRDLIAKMPTDGIEESTLRTRAAYDKAILAVIGDKQCWELTTKDVAAVLEPMKEANKHAFAQGVRTRLIAICARGLALGWMERNPADVTEKITVHVKRRRLRMEEFLAILEKAPEVNGWLQNAMLLALVSGQDRSTVQSWERSFTHGDVAIVQRSKTRKKGGIKVAIPLALRMDAVGMTLGDVINRCKSTGVISKYLIHHMRSAGAAKRGDPVRLGSISNAFAEARILAGIVGDDVPTFHEIRSLSKRTYDEQGGIDTKTLLGHMTDATAELYANSRGLAPVRVKIEAA